MKARCPSGGRYVETCIFVIAVFRRWYVRRTPLLSSRHVIGVCVCRCTGHFTHCSSSVAITDGPVVLCGSVLYLPPTSVLLSYHRRVPLPVTVTVTVNRQPYTVPAPSTISRYLSSVHHQPFNRNCSRRHGFY